MDMKRALRFAAPLVSTALLAACAAPAPQSDLQDYRARAEFRFDGDIRVSAAC